MTFVHTLSTSPFIRPNSLIFKALQGPNYVEVKFTNTDSWGFIRYFICCLLPTNESLLGIGLRYHLERFCRKILTIIPSTYSLRLPDFVLYRFCMRLLLMHPYMPQSMYRYHLWFNQGMLYISYVINRCVMSMLMIDARSLDTCIHIQNHVFKVILIYSILKHVVLWIFAMNDACNMLLIHDRYLNFMPIPFLCVTSTWFMPILLCSCHARAFLAL